MRCKRCGKDYKRIGSHWSQSDCGYPELSEAQKELLKGLLMGDGTVTEKYGTGRMTLEMTSKPFLEWVAEKLGRFATEVKLKHTAEEKIQSAKDDEYVDVVNEDAWSETYVLKTRRHPYLKELRSWYSSGEKRFPDDLELTPLMVKAWYCGDGSLHKTRNNPNVVSKSAKFATTNEADRLSFIRSLFADAGFDARTHEDCVILTVESSEELFEWMGVPPKGMEYKWV